ncbi:hypothetical protein ALQ37_200162 [Pseudomonas syringae pv. aptata]|uniref:Uncharacterized protein n=1 Tax=Pseudomonas syringae pv. aptata TaxID=83167 RepID=A0A0Q0BRF0_PSEAP|nr:hypothetical protein [Pseudomonas syringae]KPY97819.1 Unknown protein sequence [Pseudomonas syringae pv. aptata]RMO65370.1 hypothetical protein ALQ37_200162 [Pseudomonas syringae pv. aptata]
MNEHDLTNNNDSLPNLNFKAVEPTAKFPDVDFGFFEREEEKKKILASSNKVIDALQNTLDSVEEKAKTFSANLFASGFADQLRRLQGVETGLTKVEVGQQAVEQIDHYEASSSVTSRPLHQPEASGEWTAGIGIDNELDEEERLEELVSSMMEVDTEDDSYFDTFDFSQSRAKVTEPEPLPASEHEPEPEPEPVVGLDDEPEAVEAPVTHLVVSEESVEAWEEIAPDEVSEVGEVHVPDELTVPVQDDDEPVYESFTPPADVEVPAHVQAISDELAPFLAPSPVDDLQEPGGEPSKAFDAAVFASGRSHKPVPSVLDRQIRLVEKARQARLAMTTKPEFMSETANARRNSLAERSYQAKIESLNIMKDLAQQTDSLKAFLENNDLEGASDIIRLLKRAEYLKAQAKHFDKLREELVLINFKKTYKE